MNGESEGEYVEEVQEAEYEVLVVFHPVCGHVETILVRLKESREESDDAGQFRPFWNESVQVSREEGIGI